MACNRKALLLQSGATRFDSVSLKKGKKNTLLPSDISEKHQHKPKYFFTKILTSGFEVKEIEKKSFDDNDGFSFASKRYDNNSELSYDCGDENQIRLDDFKDLN